MNNETSLTYDRNTITGLVLAGGQGRRMGHQDKGLVLLGNRPLIAHVLDRLAPQVGPLIINANQNLARYAAFGHSVLPDHVIDFSGPLAGLHAALTEARTPWIVTVPCDSPLLPTDLVARLHAAAQQHGAEVAVAKTGHYLQPVFALIHRDTLPKLIAYLQGGDRKVDLWFASLHTVEVTFDDQPDAFRNINTKDELIATQDLQAGR